jgi:FtsZ-interacting cell division protein ZipA
VGFTQSLRNILKKIELHVSSSTVRGKQGLQVMMECEDLQNSGTAVDRAPRLEAMGEAATEQATAASQPEDAVAQISATQPAAALKHVEPAMQSNDSEQPAVPEMAECQAPEPESVAAQHADTGAGPTADLEQAPETDGSAPAPVAGAHVSLGEAIAGPALIQAAATQRVIWARVKGFPHWPVRTSPRFSLCYSLRCSAIPH